MYSTFHAKSEGLGDFSPCSIMKRLERWLLGRALGNPLARFRSCRQLLGHYYYLQSTTPFDEQYMCIIPVKLLDYSRIMLYVFADWLFRKLCQHIRCISNLNQDQTNNWIDNILCITFGHRGTGTAAVTAAMVVQLLGDKNWFEDTLLLCRQSGLFWFLNSNSRHYVFSAWM